MARTLLSFSKAMGMRADALSDRVNSRKQNIAVQLLIRIVHGTPVDTSKAVSDWVVGLGARASRDSIPHFMGARGSTAEQSRLVSIENGITKIAKAMPGQSIFISNDGPYIFWLEHGTVQHAPRLFVANAVSFVTAGLNK